MELYTLERPHLPEAAKLLAQRQRKERGIFADLPQAYEKESNVLKALTASFEKPDTYGMAAYKDGKMNAFFIACIQTDSERGRNVRIHYTDLAYADGTSADVFRDLYAAAAQDWLNIGCFSHYVYVPLGDPSYLKAWLHLGFAYQQAYAFLELNKFTRVRRDCEGIVFRKAVESDRHALRDASGWIGEHQSRSPGFVTILPEVSNEIKQGYEGMIDDEKAHIWVAEQNGLMVGFQAYWPVEETEGHIEIPDQAVELTVAATNPEYRNKGIATAFTDYTLSELKNEGFRHCVTNWHLLNLQSSRFWPKRGFQPYCYRLHRTIDCNIHWANGTHGDVLRK